MHSLKIHIVVQQPIHKSLPNCIKAFGIISMKIREKKTDSKSKNSFLILIAEVIHNGCSA
jgi:hypothetical protein